MGVEPATLCFPAQFLTDCCPMTTWCLVIFCLFLCLFLTVCLCVPQNASYLDREDPDLPICVEQTVLVWIPLGFLWICAPKHLISLFGKTAANNNPLSKPYMCKQVINTARLEAKRLPRVPQQVFSFLFEGNKFLLCFILIHPLSVFSHFFSLISL